jgi:hypothetical protein
MRLKVMAYIEAGGRRKELLTPAEAFPWKSIDSSSTDVTVTINAFRTLTGV